MKKFIQNIGKGISIGLGIVIIIGISGTAYAALSSLTATNGETLTSTKWNALVVHALPSGSIGPFNLSSCPTGWSEVNGTDNAIDLRGAFIRGMNGDANGRDVSRTLGSYQSDSFASHTHGPGTLSGYYKTRNLDDSGLTKKGSVGWSYTAFDFNASSQTIIIDTGNTSATGGLDTHPKNVTLLFCIKD